MFKTEVKFHIQSLTKMYTSNKVPIIAVNKKELTGNFPHFATLYNSSCFHCGLSWDLYFALSTHSCFHLIWSQCDDSQIYVFIPNCFLVLHTYLYNDLFDFSTMICNRYLVELFEITFLMVKN